MKNLKIITLSLLLAACSVNQVRITSPIVHSTETSQLTLLDNAILRTENAAPTTLNKGTKWTLIGTIEQGDIYRTKDQVVILNGFNVYEGYIVIKDKHVVGYYLPGTNSFVQSKPVIIEFKAEEFEDEN